MSAPSLIRDYLEPLGCRYGNRLPVRGENLVLVPIRTIARHGIAVLASLCESNPRDFAEEILETYLAGEFLRKAGMSLGQANYFITDAMQRRGKSEAEAVAELVAEVRRDMNAAQKEADDAGAIRSGGVQHVDVLRRNAHDLARRGPVQR